jgi:hypothetical protein
MSHPWTLRKLACGLLHMEQLLHLDRWDHSWALREFIYTPMSFKHPGKIHAAHCERYEPQNF